MEQLYPLPVDELKAALAAYPNAEDFAWVQEEPANQGAWSFVALNLLEHLEGVRLRRISRPAAAAPAVGSTKLHEAEQAALIEACAAPAEREGRRRCTSPTVASRSWSSGAGRRP